MRPATKLLIAGLVVLAMGVGGLIAWGASTLVESPSRADEMVPNENGNAGGADEAGSVSMESIAFEYSWREETSRKEPVTRPYVCEGVTYCENPFPTVEWITVPGPVVTKTDFVCAPSFEEARSMVSAEGTLTGRELDPALCSTLEEQPPEDVEESEAIESDPVEPEVASETVEPNIDEDAAMQEYLDEGEMYNEDWLKGYSEPLGAGLPNEEREDVRQVQLWLRQQGFSPGVADGYYGSSTARSVRWFQRYVGLSVDGVVGEDTWIALNKGLGY